MDLFDVVMMVSMSVLAVFFAGVAVSEWRETRLAHKGQQVDAQVIQHPRSEQRVNPAA
ncbi:hypothetical protein [Aeromicrobium sp.]|uniref:hypothetical protein n=1 Tax=Aeromicrobium sp. TaxID=1871063 RepID=UPI003C673804